MKPELLEYLIRACSREVLKQLNEGDPDIKGAAAPPADGQGTADQPPIPNPSPDQEETPKPEDTQAPPPSPSLKGIVFINPRDKSKLQKVDFKGAVDDASIERVLHRTATAAAGSNIKTALSALRAVRDAIKNPNTSVYLYIGKYDPQSEEIFLMADKSLQVAKDASVPPTEVGTPQVASEPNQSFNPTTANSSEFGQHLATQGAPTQVHGIDENIRGVIKKMVNDILNGK